MKVYKMESQRVNADLNDGYNRYGEVREIKRINVSYWMVLAFVVGSLVNYYK